MLSAQATDISVNKATDILFKDIKTPEDLVNMGEEKFKNHIKQIGLFNAKEFLDLESYENVIRWGEIINTRPAVIRGKRVNKTWGPETEQLKERHSGADFEQS